MFAKNDEQKRSILWRIVVSVTSVLIILIAGFFLVRMFTMNPLVGEWSYEDSDLMIKINGNNTAVVEWQDELDGSDMKVSMGCNFDLKTKTFQLYIDQDAVKKAVEESDGSVTAETIEITLSRLDGIYNYNMEQNQLTLTDSEYGNQMIFNKK